MRLLIYFILLFLTLSSCLDKLSYKVGSSNDINSSKKRGVFVCELQYELKKDSLNELYDDVKFNEIFIESLWRYGQRTTMTDTTDPNLKDYYHLICTFDGEFHSNLARKLSISKELEDKEYKNNLSENSTGHLTSAPFKIDNISDTISYNIFIEVNYKNPVKIGQLLFYPICN